MKEVDLLQKKPAWFKRWWGIALISFLALVFVFLVMVGYQINKIYNQKKAGSYITGAAPYDMSLFVDQLSPSWGSDEAEITIIEFGDFNCPRCLQFFPVGQYLKEKYSDKVKFYWRNFPVVKESSFDFALAGVCADRQGKFWEMHDLFFARQGTISLGDVENLAKEVGLDVEKFNVCLDHSLTMAQLRKDFFAAQDANVQGTPTFLINGYKIQGALTREAMDQILEKFFSIYESDNTN